MTVKVGAVYQACYLRAKPVRLNCRYKKRRTAGAKVTTGSVGNGYHLCDTSAVYVELSPAVDAKPDDPTRNPERMLIWLAILGYFISGLVALHGLYRVRLPDRRALFWPATVGALAHLSTLTSEIIVFGGLQIGFLNSASVITFFVVSVLLISGWSKPLHSLFAFVFPAAALIMVVAVLAPEEAIPRLYRPGVVFHVFISMLAYSVITIATVLAALLGAQNRQLHNHHLDSRLNRFLPPLQTMERLLFEWLMIGFVLLTASMISGGLFVENLFAQHLVHKTVLTFVAWIFFAVLLFGHFHLGWRGATASRLTVFGFFFLMLAFFGSKFVLEYLL